eukprot:8590423-Alexandrium_andersonii.AAC.1
MSHVREQWCTGVCVCVARSAWALTVMALQTRSSCCGHSALPAARFARVRKWRNYLPSTRSSPDVSG